VTCKKGGGAGGTRLLLGFRGLRVSEANGGGGASELKKRGNEADINARCAGVELLCHRKIISTLVNRVL